MCFPGQSFDQSSETWRSLGRVASLCNRATFRPGQEGVPIPKVQIKCFKREEENPNFQTQLYITVLSTLF